MTVNPKDIEEMAKLRRLMEGGFEESSTPDNRTPTGSKLEIGASQDAKTDMKAILMAMYGTQESLQRVTESADNPQRFTQALNTELTEDGVKVGSWKIQVHEHTGNKTFDILHVNTLEPIATDLTLYETALAITTCLNKKMTINSPRIKEILALEEKYADARYEAALFKRKASRLVESKNLNDAQIAQARYQEYKSTAIYYRNKIRNIANGMAAM